MTVISKYWFVRNTIFYGKMDFNPAFTKNELYHFLMQRGVEEDDAKKFQEEKVDGETFQDITEAELKEIGVKLGTRKKIMKIIQNFKQSLLANAELQDLQILGGDSNLSNSLVFDLIAASSSCTVIPAASPTISSTTSLASSATKLLSSPSSTAQKSPAVTKKNYKSSLKKKSSSFIMETIPSLYKSTVADLCTEDATGEALSIYADPKNIDVLATINKHTTGKIIINNLKGGRIINRSDVNEIVRIVVHTMIEDLRTLYPSSAQKINLAKAIVRDIPELKSNREGVEGYEQFYDPKYNSGSIEWRLKTLRIRVPPSKKKNRGRTHIKPKDKNKEKEGEEEEFVIDDDTLKKVNFLKSQPALEINKAEIFKNNEETFHVRRNFIVKKSPSIAEILEVFPQLKEFDGALIDADFKLIYPNAGSLAESLPMYSEKIRMYVSQKRHDIAYRVCHVADENLKAMMYLADLLPIPGIRKRQLAGDDRSCHPSEALITFTGQENSIIPEEDLANHLRLLCCGEAQDEQLQFFLVLDKYYVDLGECFLKAFDILYKSYKVFNVECPKILTVFYSFLDTMIYKIHTGAVRSSVEHLNNILCCVNTNS